MEGTKDSWAGLIFNFIIRIFLKKQGYLFIRHWPTTLIANL
jgi:hypothetical protein